MPDCPSPCSGTCTGDTCVCVILGTVTKCKGVSNIKELIALLDDADEIHMWAGNPLIKSLHSKINAEKSLILKTINNEDGILSLSRR